MHLQPSVVGKSEASIVLFTEQHWWCNVLLSEPAGAHSQRNPTSRVISCNRIPPAMFVQ